MCILLCMMYVMTSIIGNGYYGSYGSYGYYGYGINIVHASEPAVEVGVNLSGEQKEQLEEKDITVDTTADLGLQSKSVLLMEASTGTIIYENNSEEQLSPASITKIMTLILIFDAIESGRIKMDDMVTTSSYAKSMGGSQVFLEEGEQQTVETMIKCIVVASGNDAAVAMAEHIAGSEAEFVNQMNERAKGLGMNGTHFIDCCGLTDSDEHYTTAKDVAIMSRELVTKYPQIHKYSTIWMENITHTTQKGTSEFCLSNTNKLLKQYEYCTGLKTGSTSKAKYCLSATAEKDGIKLISVIMAAPDYKVRFAEAISLFQYGYANCKLYKDSQLDIEEKAKVENGVVEMVEGSKENSFSYLSTTGEDFSNVEKRITWEVLQAPIEKGQTIGTVEYYIGEKKLGEVNIISKESVKKAGYLDYLKKMFSQFQL